MGDVQLFIDELKSWVGTPFSIGDPVKGRSTDCLNYIIKSGADLFPEFKKTFAFVYPMSVRTRFSSNDIPEFIKFLDGNEDVIYERPDKEYKAGDVVIFKYGKLLCHCAVFLGDGYFIDTMKGRSVDIKYFCPQVKMKIEKVFRIRRFD